MSPLKYLFNLIPPELAHYLGICALQNGWLPPRLQNLSPALKMNVAGLEFMSPVGLAAGFDKNAEAIKPLLDQGFSFVELGTVTPKAQKGNPRPRVFRLMKEEGIINFLGFNNKGSDNFVSNIQAFNEQNKAKNEYAKKIIGANIGRGAEGSEEDYVELLNKVYNLADYITINISSPNTQNLRALQDKEELRNLLSLIKTAREQFQGKRTPIFVKISPDINNADAEYLIEAVKDYGMDGLIISNTTINCEELRKKYKIPAGKGGLSGKPLFARSNELIKYFYKLSQGSIPIIGVGGIMNAENAYQKILCGATLVQFYTGLVYRGFDLFNEYRGFGLIDEIHTELPRFLERDGFKTLKEAVGIYGR